VAATKTYLQNLMAAAVALPGIATGAGSDDGLSLDYKHMLYEESNGLMTVHANYLSAAMGLTDSSDLSFKVEYETMSGASPIFMTPDIDGTPLLVKSGASVVDERTSVAATYSYDFGSSKLSLAPSWSNENDYTSTALTAQYEFELNGGNSTIAFGAGFADDQVWASGSDIKNDKQGSSAFVGITQVLTEKSLMQFNVSVANESGFLNDPYKLVQIQDTIAFDARPDERTQTSALARYIRHMGDGFSLRFSYRYFQDDWDVQSHTLEAAWYQETETGWLINPSVRYYTQDKARFYEPYFVELRTDGFYTSDFRLASYGSVMAGLRLGKTVFETTRVSLSFDFYERRGELKLGGEHSIDPEPLNSYVLTLGISYDF
jgi:hypothetical protein